MASDKFASISERGHIIKQGGFNGTGRLETLRDLTGMRGKVKEGTMITMIDKDSNKHEEIQGKFNEL